MGQENDSSTTTTAAGTPITSGDNQSSPYENVVTQVVQKIKSEPFLFVIAIVALLIGLVTLAAGLGSTDLRFTIAVIALLAFAVIAGYYVQSALQTRAELQRERMRLGHANTTSAPTTGTTNAPDTNTTAASPPSSTDPRERTADTQQSDPGTVPPITDPAQMSFAQKAALIDALLACPSVQNRHTRDTIVNNLTPEIKSSIQRQENARADVDEILTRCLDFPGGLQQLVQIVAFYEKNSRPIQKLNALLAQQ